jgi:HEAT repeat protein
MHQRHAQWEAGQYDGFFNRDPKEAVAGDLAPEIRAAVLGLYSAKPDERVGAAVSIGNMRAAGAPAVPYMVAALEEENCAAQTPTWITLSAAARDGLAAIGEPAFGSVLDSLNKLSVRGRRYAVQALDRIDSKRCRACMRQWAADPQWMRRATAAWALGLLMDRDSVSLLIAGLDDPEHVVAWWSYASLIQVTGKKLGRDRRRWQQWYEDQGQPSAQYEGTKRQDGH